jgi:hypothetical protein
MFWSLRFLDEIVFKSIDGIEEKFQGIHVVDLFVALCCLGSVDPSFCDELCVYGDVKYLSIWEL